MVAMHVSMVSAMLGLLVINIYIIRMNLLLEMAKATPTNSADTSRDFMVCWNRNKTTIKKYVM